MPLPAPKFVSFNVVPAAQADEFDGWIQHTIIAAMNEQRPNLAGGVHVFRAAEEADGTVAFAIFFDQGELSDWSIEPFLADAIGLDAARKELARMDQMSPDGQTSFVLTPVGEE